MTNMRDIKLLEKDHIQKVENQKIIDTVMFNEHSKTTLYNYICKLIDSKYPACEVPIESYELLLDNYYKIEKYSKYNNAPVSPDELRDIVNLLAHPSRIHSVTLVVYYEDTIYKDVDEDDLDDSDYFTNNMELPIDLTKKENQNIRIDIINRITKGFYKNKRLGNFSTKFLPKIEDLTKCYDGVK